MISVEPTRLPVERNDRMRQTAEVLLAARRECNPIAELAPGLRPQTLEEAYAVQDVMAQALGGVEQIGGWKVGAPSPEATPVYAPMPLVGGFLAHGATLGPSYSRLRGIEAEVAFRLGRDLPSRAEPYSQDEVFAAIASAHPVIEVLESAFVDPDAVDRLSMIADLQIHGGFAYGAAVTDWQALDLGAEALVVIVDGIVRFEKQPTAGAGPYLLRLVTWLANEGQQRTGGLEVGQFITTGSWCGKLYALPGSAVEVQFSRLGTAAMRFGEKA